jgi:hypothetical protein
VPYLFHAKPSSLSGSFLLPLSDLATTDPSAYAAAIAKYDDHPDRRRLPDRYIPIIDCRWQDVVFLSPVHPAAIWRAWAERRFEMPSRTFFAVDAAIVAELPAVVYTQKATRSGDDIDPADVVAFDPVAHTDMQLSDRTLTWYDARIAAGSRGGAEFHTVPHVLVRGRIPIRGAAELDWRDG